MKISRNSSHKTIKTTTKFFTAALICQFAICNLQLKAQSIGINSTGAAPNASALLDVDAAPGNNKGLLLPRLSTTQRNSIVAPAQSLLIYNTTDSCYQGYIGTQWISFGCVGSGSTPPPPPPIIFPCTGFTIPIVDVTNVFTGKIWMDRNLGALQVATSSTDAAAYGCLYQWGRLADGHESRTSGTTTTLSTTDAPGHADFITTSNVDWRTPSNNTLWQGVAGTNNPCPTGYRLPTEIEFNNERLSWVQPPISSTNTIVGAFASPLKLSAGGRRAANGAIGNEGLGGVYWSSTFNGANNARFLNINNTTSIMNNFPKAGGLSVRCIKD